MKKKAFTLIEILIVITIIGILTAMALLAYSGSVERQQLLVFKKNLLATAQQEKERVFAGEKNEDAVICLGIYFEKDAQPKRVSMDFAPDTGECDFQTAELTDLEESSSKISVTALSVGGTSQDAAYLIFTAPMAEVEIYNGNEALLSGDLDVSFEHSTLGSGFDFSVESLTGKIYEE